MYLRSSIINQLRTHLLLISLSPKNNIFKIFSTRDCARKSVSYQHLQFKKNHDYSFLLGGFFCKSLTGKQQHGFKKNKSTTTLGLKLQSLLARALDENNYALMASLDLSAAFDVVNTKLLLKRIKIKGLPEDAINLIKCGLTDRFFYVTVDGQNYFFIVKLFTLK